MHVCRRYILVFLWLGLLTTQSVVVVAQQAPVWVRYAWGNDLSSGLRPYDIAVSSDTSIYVAGNADLWLNGVTFSSENQNIAVPGGATDTSHAFLVQYSSGGQINWIRRGASEPNIALLGPAVTHYNVTPLGTEGVVISEGLLRIAGTNMFAEGGLSLHRYDSAGLLEWSRHLGTPNIRFEQKEAFIRGMGSDANGHIYLAGVFNDTLRIGATTLAPGVSADGHPVVRLFLASFFPDGTVRWIREGTNLPQPSHIQTLAVAPRGDIYVGGYFAQGARPDTSASSFGQDTHAVIKYDREGHLVWVRTDIAKSFHIDKRSERVSLAKLAVGSDDDLFVGWRISDLGSSSQIVVGEVELFDVRGGGAFVTSYTSAGDLRWVQQFQSNGGERINDLAVTPSGGLLVAGDFDGDLLNLDGTRLSNSSNGSLAIDGFIAKYSREGELEDVAHAAGSGYARFQAIAASPTGDIIATGESGGALQLGNGNIMQAQSGQDIFVAKYVFAQTTRSEYATELRPNVGALAAYPNPFAASTTISYNLIEASSMHLSVFDMLGRKVATLFEGHQNAGTQSVVFDASSLPSGLYVYRLEAGELVQTGTIQLAK